MKDIRFVKISQFTNSVHGQQEQDLGRPAGSPQDKRPET